MSETRCYANVHTAGGWLRCVLSDGHDGDCRPAEHLETLGLNGQDVTVWENPGLEHRGLTSLTYNYQQVIEVRARDDLDGRVLLHEVLHALLRTDPQRVCLADDPRHEDFVRMLWGWKGSTERPTFTPSILVGGLQWAEADGFYKPSHSKVPSGGQIVCHSFLTDGVWNFLADCTHDRAGQSVPMVDLPDWLDGVWNFLADCTHDRAGQSVPMVDLPDWLDVEEGQR